MKGIERAPFSGGYTKIGPRVSTDSVAVLLHNPRVERDPVIKWNRSEIENLGEAQNIVKFRQKSLQLYGDVLGSQYLVPTQFVIGEKVDRPNFRLKVYQVQPYVSGWDGKTLPEDLRHDDKLLADWRNLYTRLAHLYTVASDVNKDYPEEERFPVNVTLGNSRLLATSGLMEQGLQEIPRTPNLLIDRTTLALQICDLGPYTPWSDRMEAAYERIHREAGHTVQAGETV